ncbi:AAA family ATPase [Jeotgalibaca sp. MA1X17-3]|uniref:chromosome segregation SMC family protein n=1 Tax=Jeotgalibaca sp. MA1X17-3 TaxID=2908211 RepID=UPI001F3C024D|nr:AAA family ATPase [Jeotgalibaca sp. MA1X17-3]UJF14929.1 AAA family ATPase [Jeotgalibaca sp. MA1X17-3]
MHLEKIEMTGFKSFADKTVIEFDQGVTAVVGPNGSGKSNLSEAVRWVLGEQSAKNLRGKKMDDIVFAGSESRKPVNIAEVTLLFNNEDQTLPIDFSQVSITRRMNRNGESNCFINKKPCRLKDITDLLMDSGIGKDSFSMISQGKVEQIFQNKPEERRSIFEDAAGIAKYKSRKISAERKLERTEEHLNRVEDILHEITSQLTPLEVQRNTALQYQNKKKELSDIEIALIAVEIETVSEQWQLSKKELIQYQERTKKLETDQSEAQNYLSILKHKEAKINDDIDLLQEEHVQVIQKLEQLEGQKNILEQKADFSTKSKKQQKEIIQDKVKLIEEQELNATTLSSKSKEFTLKK